MIKLFAIILMGIVVSTSVYAEDDQLVPDIKRRIRPVLPAEAYAEHRDFILDNMLKERENAYVINENISKLREQEQNYPYTLLDDRLGYDVPHKKNW